MKKDLFILLIVSLLCAQWPADSVYARAKACESVRWTATETNTNNWFYQTYGETCTGANEIYLQCDFKPGIEYRSIAYSYGGEDTDFEFTDKIEKGYFIGSHLCHYQTYGDPSDTVAGTDCSGFLSWCWNVPRQSTGMFINNSAYDKISWTEVKGGDALVKAGSHAVLVLDGTDPAATLIIESTSAVNGVRKRLIDRDSEYWQRYTPLRNPKITGIIGIKQTPLKTSTALKMTVEERKLIFSEEITSLTLYALNGTILLSSNRMSREFTVPPTLASGIYLTVFKTKRGEQSTSLIIP